MACFYAYLLGTKLRALFQRQKGRDLFDLWYSLKNTAVNCENIVKIFYHYLEKQNLEINRAQFQENLSMKLLTDPFLQDIHPILDPIYVINGCDSAVLVRLL